MSIITAATITRAAPLPTSPLDINTGVYRISGADGIDPGGVQWDKKKVSSPWVHGDVPVHQRKTQSQGRLQIQIRSTTQAGVATALDTLLDALYQQEWQLSITFESTTAYTWDCYAADVNVGMIDERWANYNVLVLAQFDRSPVPVAGAI